MTKLLNFTFIDIFIFCQEIYKISRQIKKNIVEILFMILFYIKAFILGIIEGLTEFIPVSSTAHLLVLGDLLQFNTNVKNIFVIVIQLGAILAVCYEYKKIIFKSIFGALRPSSNKEQKTSINFILSIIVALIPFGVVGFAFYPTIKAIFNSQYLLLIIGSALIIGGLILLRFEKEKKQRPAIEKIKDKTNEIHDIFQIPLKKSFAIGLFQLLAMIPGTSRSAATIIGGLSCNLSRKTATEFSFLLAIPTMFGAVFYDLYKSWTTINSNELLIIFIGFVTAYISALFVIRWAIRYIEHHSFKIFAKYRIMAGLGCYLYFLTKYL